MGAIDERERILADSQFGAGADGIYAPASWFLGLSTTEPLDDGSNFTEPSGGAYARVEGFNQTFNFPAAVTTAGQTVKTIVGTFNFPDPTTDWGVIGWFGWFTAATGGVPQFWYPLEVAITVKAGHKPVVIRPGSISMIFD
jgi:hypothetical protein